MVRYNLLFFVRNLLSNKRSFIINSVGLTTGLACVLFIFLWVTDELGIDRFHENRAHLYQVMMNFENSDGIFTSEGTPSILAETLKEEYPEVTHAIGSTIGFGMPLFTLSPEDKNINAKGLFVDKDFFEMFSFPLLRGQKESVFEKKRSIVISEQMAVNLYGSLDAAIGKSLEVKLFGPGQQFLISGIVDYMGEESSVQFDFLVPFILFKELLGDAHLSWGNTGPRSFILLNPETDPEHFSQKIKGFMLTKDQNSNASLFLRRYSDKYLYNNYENGVQAGGRIDYVKLFSLIGTFILVIACINFVNLSTATASKRAKEIGVKKSLGAARKSLWGQFMLESVLMAVFSGLLSFVLVVALLSQFNQITGKQLTLSLNREMLLGVTCIVLLTGLIAGIYPSFLLSRFNPIPLLKGGTDGSGSGPSTPWLRNGLVVFQFAQSIILIVAVLIVSDQIGFVQSRGLGFEKDNLVYTEPMGSADLESLLFRIEQIPGVVEVSSTNHTLTGLQNHTYGVDWEGKNEDDRIQFEVVMANYGLIETLGMNMKEGDSFSKDFGADSTKIIFNEEAIKIMGLKNPIGKKINLWGEEHQIKGIVKNFHFQSLHEAVKPLFIVLRPKEANRLLIRINKGRERETLKAIAETYTRINPGGTFKYRFLDDELQTLYEAEQRVGTLSMYFAVLAIVISSLGLFGLAIATTERRRREIGIRKVLGQSREMIVLLLTREFAKPVLLSVIIALPISYLVSQKWLSGFAYSIPLSLWYFLGAGLISLFIALLTVSSQAMRAANINPVNVLKEE
ncbi:MAG: FtsX-like permease family protein [Bacteroidota bacterium]